MRARARPGRRSLTAPRALQVAALEADIQALERAAETRGAEAAAERRRADELAERCFSQQAELDRLADEAEYERAHADGLRVVLGERDEIRQLAAEQRATLKALAAERDALADDALARAHELDARTAELARLSAELADERRSASQLHAALAERDELLAGVRREHERASANLAAERARAVALRDGLVERDGRVRTLEAQLAAQRDATATALRRYESEVGLRRQLDRRLRDLKGNVRVLCRVRPLLAGVPAAQPALSLADAAVAVVGAPWPHGAAASRWSRGASAAVGGTMAVSFPEAGVVAVHGAADEGVHSAAAAATAAAFDFDAVFGPASTQAQLYAEVRELVPSVLDGYDVCIFAYGPTGSGKTHTMAGPVSDRGINPRALHDVLEHAQRRRGEHEDVELRVCMFEIYNNVVRDLMGGAGAAASGGGGADGAHALDLSAGAFDEWSASAVGGASLPGMFSARVHSVDDIMTVMAIGNSLRARASTDLNTLSSRSHAVLVLRAACTNRLTGAQTVGRMHLIDLAGSEDAGRSGARRRGGAVEEEAAHINSSLEALGRVMRAHARRVPADQIDYGASALTQLLKGSLQAQTKMVMLVHVNPAPHLALETAATLEFGASVRDVELGKATRRALPASRERLP